MSNIISGEEDLPRPVAVNDDAADLSHMGEGLELLASYKSITNKDVRLSIKDFLAKIACAIQMSSSKSNP